LNEDYQFVGSTVAMVTNYLKKKMNSSQNFKLALESYIEKYKQSHPLPPPTTIKTNIKYEIE
jgi:hypothetical protein